MLGLVTCAATPLCADGYSELDNFLLAAKDFPFPPDESDLPANAPSSCDNNGSSSQGQSNGSENDINPEVNTNKPKAGKDIIPSPESDGSGNDINPDVNTYKPKAGKDIIPPEPE